MRYGIPLLGDRVAPRSTYADSMLTVVLRRNRARTETSSKLADRTLLELAKTLTDNRIDVLVCGGISRQEREFLSARRLEIIDNVVGSVDELLEAIGSGAIRPGFGLQPTTAHETTVPPTESSSIYRDPTLGADGRSAGIDCLACTSKQCLRGEDCDALGGRWVGTPTDQASLSMREAALDVSFESERTLCRLSELIYFCLEMHYQKIGLAYCVDLEEPTEILVHVLRRFFDVYPVCCKIGGQIISDAVTPPLSAKAHSSSCQVACNPFGQAEALNRCETDINVLVGLCVGSDCLLTKLSEAPVTTLFVKDKSLANNPIGAVYSDYYLKEAMQAVRGGSGRSLS